MLHVDDSDTSTKFKIVKRLDGGASVYCYKAVGNDKSGILRQVKSEGWAAENYLRAYKDMQKILLDNEAIKSFIPSGEIYRDENNRAYVWNEGLELEIFEDVCAAFKEKIQPDAADNLRLILNAMKNLTQCVLELHKAGLIHRDIKPSNFGFVRRGGELLTQTISIFDIDTICKADDEPRGLVGTPGFTDRMSTIDNKTDIYSIGATFFYALIGRTFDDADLDNLKNIVAECPIAQNLIGLQPKLKALIAKILNDCLCWRDDRYESCELLLSDLDAALKSALSIKEQSARDIATAIQNQLYEVPLYNRQSERALKVLTIGFGQYAQMFLDDCLTLGQLPKTELDVTVVDSDRADFDLYLVDRPALREFFSVDGEEVADNYGQIHFERCDESDFDAFDGFDGYVFRERQFIEALKVSERQEDIERQAFNVHLLWEKNLQVDYEKLKKDFRRPYNHNSCVLNVISLKYKMHALGIDVEKLSPAECAEALDDILFADTPQAQQLLDELIYYEHRRWVTEKICGGWVKREVIDCRDGLTRDPKKKTHVCIVRSRPDQMLRREFDLGLWDKCSEHQLNKLDELDRMSVELHRLFMRQAKIAMGDNLLNGEQMIALKNLSSNDKNTLAAVNEWSACAADIWNGNLNLTSIYQRLLDGAKNAIENLPPNLHARALTLIEYIDNRFKPVRLSMEYKNYKDIDGELILGAPFILTYTEEILLAVPFNVGDNTELFGNIAAASVLNPKTLMFLMCLSNAREANSLAATLEQTLPRLFEYADKKNLRAEFEFILAFDEETVPVDLCDDIKNIIENAGDVKKFQRLKFTDDEIVNAFEQYLKSRRANGRLIALERNASPLASMFRGGGLYKRFDSFEFDMLNQKFSTRGACRTFEYIRKPTFLTVADLFSFNQSQIVKNDKPEFFYDYKKLWAMYRRSPRVWKELCNWLLVESSANALATFKKFLPARAESKVATFNYVIPIECHATVEKILAALKDAGIIEDESRSIVETTTACFVTIKTRSPDGTFGSECDRLFENPYKLMNANFVDVQPKSAELVVRFDSLMMRGLNRPNDLDLINLLNELCGANFLVNLKITADKVSFTYATYQIKNLLTTAGRILEIYVYHQLEASGQFDDITCGCEVDWQGIGARNEFDCIATRGFQSFFIECKAQSKIEQDYYHKLSSLVRQFGLNATAVLIADTLEKDWQPTGQSNEMQRQRGALQNVLTVWKADEIEKIDRVLKNFSAL